MKIKLDDTHTLVSDPMCYWIEETITPKEGKQKPYTRRCSGYTATFERVVESYIEKQIKSSEAEKVIALAKEVKAMKAEVRNWHETVS